MIFADLDRSTAVSLDISSSSPSMSFTVGVGKAMFVDVMPKAYIPAKKRTIRMLRPK
jgi:hypothetical protein